MRNDALWASNGAANSCEAIHDEINSCRKAIHSCPHAAFYLGSLERGAGFCEAKD